MEKDERTWRLEARDFRLPTAFVLGGLSGGGWLILSRWPAWGAGVAVAVIALLVAGLTLSLLTTRRRAERLVAVRTAELRESEARYRTLSANSPLGIFHTDASGRCLYANARYREITGLGPDGGVGHDWRRAIHPEDIHLVFDGWRAAVREERDLELDLRFQLPDGSVRWAHVHGSALRDEDNEVAGLICTVADTTERVRIERERYILDGELRQTQKLESLGMLAGGVAHEFNNLLTAILGNIGLARMDASDEAAVREYLSEIEGAAHGGADLCRQMLSYSGKGIFILQRTNVSTVVDNVLHLLRLSVGRKVLLDVRTPAGLPDVEADPGQLGQLVLNLGTNAAEAMGEEGGTIIVETGVLGEGLPEGLDAGTYAYIEVSDNGKGISPEHQRLIFDPFFSTKFTGRGLGLAVVQGIADAHRGTLTVESEVGRGATFRLLLPVLEDAVAGADGSISGGAEAAAAVAS